MTLPLARRIARRRKALRWFITDPAKVLFAKPPSKRLCNLMLAEGLLDLENRDFGLIRMRPTAVGAAVLEGSPC